MANDVDESTMSLAELISLPTTIALNQIYSKRVQNFVDKHPYIKMGRVLGSGFVQLFTNVKHIGLIFTELGNSYTLLPALLSPVSAMANSAAGITQVLEHPYLDLSGRGVIIGFVDTGIDYRRDVFQYEDGTSKIISIWDQTISGARRATLNYGSEYSREQINEALRAENPLELVPTTDPDGHGTFLASVAAGRKTHDYIGAAPGSEIVVVKLRRANQFFVDLLLLPPDKPNYFENGDVMQGIQYMVDVAKERNMPLVICIGIGSNDAGHDGNTLFEEYVSYLTQRPGIAIVTAAGNESNAKHHTQGNIFRTGSTDTIGIRVGERSTSFSVNIFSAAYDKISVGIISPMGEVISRVPFSLERPSREELIFEKTTISVTYFSTTNSVVTIGFLDAKEGVWEIVLYGDSILTGDYHAWLPITYQVSPEVEFLKPVPEYTIVYPSTASRVISCGAYDAGNSTLYVSSSWGPTRMARMAPDFVAPGVNEVGVYPTGLGRMTGTSVAAAVTSGAAAILMEWGVVQGNLVNLDGDLLRQLLISGCRRGPVQEYPNIRWGYGALDLYATLWGIRETGTNLPQGGGALSGI